MLPRRALIVLVFATLAVAGGWTGYWFYAADLARGAIEAWVTARRGAGDQIAHGPIALSGYPLAIVARLPQPAVSRPAANLAWRADELTVEARPWDLSRFRLAIAGHQVLSLTLDRPYEVTVAAATATALAEFERGSRLASAELRLLQATVGTADGTGPFTVSDLWLKATPAAARPTVHTEPVGRLSLRLDGLGLPPDVRTPLGSEIASLRLDLRVLGRFAGTEARDAVEFWRTDGGTIEVPWLDLRWGPLDLRARGTLALDEEGRPLGAFSAEIRGHQAVVGALSAADMIDGQTAALARAGLAILSDPGPEGESVLSVPVTAQDGRLHLGPLNLLALPRVWPAAPVPAPTPPG